jgi:Cof subfamily protein (haloacid dehalogenase superfamily)
MIKLLALDLDGTLLDAESRFFPGVHEAVMAAQAAGLEVVLVTGRSWRGAQAFYQALSLKGRAICYLGALVVDGQTGAIIRHRPLVAEAWAQVRKLALAEQLAVTACVGADAAVEEGALPARNLVAADTAIATRKADDFTGWEAWNPYTEIAPDLAAAEGPPTMAAIYGDRAVQRVLAAFPGGLPESQFDLTDKIRGERVLHIWHTDVDKGRALAAYCRYRGVLPEEVAAFGDAPMDLSMIKFAGLGVAVPDAHPALRAAADLVAGPAEAIRHILQERGETA